MPYVDVSGDDGTYGRDIKPATDDVRVRIDFDESPVVAFKPREEESPALWSAGVLHVALENNLGCSFSAD